MRAKIAGSDHGGEQSSFGRVQAGVSAAYLGMAEEAYGRLKVMAAKRSMYPSLITSHEPNGGILNTDGNGGIPHIVNTMLAFSRSDRLDLLPALPAAWPEGSIRGLPVRCGCLVDLAWSQGRLVSATLRAQRDMSLTIRYDDQAVPIRLGKGETIRLDAQLRLSRPDADSNTKGIRGEHGWRNQRRKIWRSDGKNVIGNARRSRNGLRLRALLRG